MPTFDRLTRAAMRKLQPGQSLHEHGITYTRLASGDARWSVNVMVSRRRVHQVVGLESAGYTRTQAEELVARLKGEKSEQAHGIPTAKGARPTTIEKAVDDYLEYLESHGGKDIASKRVRLQQHVVPELGTIRCDQLQDSDWERYCAARRGEGASDATVNRERAALLHMLRTLVKRRKLRAVPCVLKRHQETQGRLIYLEPEEFRALLKAAEEDESPHSYPFCMIAGYTGMRHEPVLALRAGDIDLRRCIIHVRKDKAGAREQPMPEILAEYLRAYVRGLQPEDWLFPSNRAKSGRVYQMSSQFARCVARAGLPANVTPHVLRHTVATNSARAGLDTATIAALGGWKTKAMAERYQHAAKMADAMAVLERQLSGSVTRELQRSRRRTAAKPRKTSTRGPLAQR